MFCKSISNVKCSYTEKYEIYSDEIVTDVKIFYCLNLEVFID